MARFGSWVLDERKFLSFEELARLRRHVRRRVDRSRLKKRLPWLEWFLVELALETGLRVAEMASLNCSDLVISVDRCGTMVRHGKGGKSRFVRIRPRFAKTCQNFLHWKETAQEPVSDDAPVFLSPKTKSHMTTRGLQKMFLRCCGRVNIAGHSVHHCRHTYASHLYKASGHDLRMVQRQLGHASVKTTEVYAHVFDQDIDRAVERLYGERHCAVVGK